MGLRSEWTAEQIRENLDQAHEGLPEATTTDRFPVEGTAGGMDFLAGEETEAQTPTYPPTGDAPGLPADPPRRHDGLAG